MNNTLSLRERKKYITKNNILNEFMLALQDNDFQDILIEEICAKVNISKVTFFRYFSTKEEVLDYFVMRWCYERSVEINKGLYTAKEGIFHVFLSAACIPNAEKIIVSLIHYYSKLKEKPNKKVLSDYERYMFSQDSQESIEGAEINLLSLEHIFMYYISQMTTISELDKLNYVRQLVAIFYGIPFQVHIHMLDAEALADAYKTSLELLFGTDIAKGG